MLEYASIHLSFFLSISSVFKLLSMRTLIPLYKHTQLSFPYSPVHGHLGFSLAASLIFTIAQEFLSFSYHLFCMNIFSAPPTWLCVPQEAFPLFYSLLCLKSVCDFVWNLIVLKWMKRQMNEFKNKQAPRVNCGRFLMIQTMTIKLTPFKLSLCAHLTIHQTNITGTVIISTLKKIECPLSLENYSGTHS